MVLLRPRCHYCGKRHVKEKGKNEERQFKCEHCLAVNFLDENGEIADVPPEEAADPQQILNQIDSPAGSQFESAIFCQTCLKNQLYFNRTLSEYLPDLDDPSYAMFEAALPGFRKKLEDRYPQVCAQCEPRVRQQLQQATYTAKSDHVRRMLAKSRERRIASRLGWRRVIVALGGLGYWMSIAGQSLWHAMGALSSDRIWTTEAQSSICVQKLFMDQSSTTQCTESLGYLAGNALKLGILCIWWNPKWQHKLAGLEGRLSNLDTYYQVQVGLLGLRFAIWTFLQSSVDATWLSELLRAAHAVSLVLLSILTIWSNYAIIKVDITPLVDWNQQIGPLLSEHQFVPPQAPVRGISTPLNSQSTWQPQHFPVGQLGTIRPEYDTWRPPTPPVNDPDAMDWEPMNNQFTAKPRKLAVKQVQPSPFHGTLPALNPRGVRNPKITSEPEQREAMGIPPGFFDSGRRSASQTQAQAASSTFAEPSFFPQQDKDSLGLEKIFDDVFKLRDELAPTQPAQIAVQQQQAMPAMFSTPTQLLQHPNSLRGPVWSLSNRLAAASLPILVINILIWVVEDIGLSCPQELKLCMSIFAAGVSTFHLALKITSNQRSSEHLGLPRSFGTFLSLAEAVILAMLSTYRWTSGYEVHGSRGQIDPFIYAGIIWQELYYFWTNENEGSACRVLPSSVDPTTSIQPMESSPNPSEATTIQQTGFGRPRGNSIDSMTSSISATSTTSTAPGWKTPKLNARNPPSIGGPSPGFGLGGLMIDDFGGSGASITGPRQRTTPTRGRGRGR